MRLRIWAAAAAMLCASQASATVQVFSIVDLPMYPVNPTPYPNPYLQTGMVEYTFDPLNPDNTVFVSAINFVIDGKSFTLADVVIQTHTNAPPGNPTPIGGIVIGGIPSGANGLSVGSTDFALRIWDAYTNTLYLVDEI